MTFSDNFNRADGNLGANWTSPNNWVHIASNQAVASSTSYAHCTAVSEAGAQTVSATFVIGAAISTNCYVHVKSNDAENAYYSGQITGTSGNITATITSVAHGGAIATVWSPISVGTTYKLTLTYNSGFLTLYVDDVPICWAKDSTYATQARVAFGLPAGAYACTLFEAAGVSTATFTVSPSAALTSGPPITLYLHGSGTAWTPGSPGTPTFTASGGTLSDQSVSSAGEATVTFTPPVTDQVVTITDPSTSLTDTIDVNGDASPGGGWGNFQPRLTQAGADALNDPAALWSGFKAIGDLSIVFPAVEGVNPDVDFLTTIQDIWHGIYPGKLPGQPDFQDLLTLLWQLINGESAYVAGMDLAAQLALTKGLASAVLTYLQPIGSGYTDINSIVALLGGTPTIYSNADLMTAIGNLSGGSNQDVLDALAAYFGQNPPTIEQLGTMVSNLATIAGYDLGDVLDAIAAIPAPDLSAITNKLALIQPSTAADLTTLTNGITGVDNVVDATSALLTLVAGEGEVTLAMILEAVEALQALVPKVPPVWPGSEGVTLGAGVPFDANVSIDDDMDGVIVSVTTPPTGTGRYLVGNATLDYGVGRLAFVDDSGHIEPWQYLGFRSALFTPKSMAHASGVKLQVLGGAEGTVTPWVMS